MSKKIVVILKGYPRLSETFIAQELLGLERAGFELLLASLRHPTDKARHPIHDEISAPVNYLPEYLHKQPWRVLRALMRAKKLPGFKLAMQQCQYDLSIMPARNQLRRFGQAAVLATELPASTGHLHAHFIHTPGSVAHYVALMTGLKWTCSAHAKDIWTSPDEDLMGKLIHMSWVVTCTKNGWQHLRKLSNDPDKVHLSYHGLDLGRFDPPPVKKSTATGKTDAPVQLITVCRAVEKKGLDILLKALALLADDLNWRLSHIGAGDLVKDLQAQAADLGIADRIEWLGSQPQTEVLARYRQSDLFVLPCRIAHDGDRDGLPNVIVEAQSQRLPVISTTVSGVPELIEDGLNGLLCEAEAPEELAKALEKLIGDPALRDKMGKAGEKKVREKFDHTASIAELTELFAKVGIKVAK